MLMTQVSSWDYLIINYSNCYGAGIRIDPVDGEHILMGVEADTGVHYLEIIEATDEDEGTYICKITTEIGTAESTFTLVVEPGNCVYLVCIMYLWTYVC